MALRIQAGGTPTIQLAGSTGASIRSPEDQVQAEKLFAAFSEANSLKNITSLFQKFCECLKLRPSDYRTFYPRLKERMSFSWKWKAFQAKLDKRTAQKDYGKATCCSGNKVLIVGAGPCGLRAAIEASLLGAKVVVLEKRDRFSRNNVLHLWPFVITDLRNLGAKKFYPKFCGGSVDHVSIRILQCILLKVCLLLGVEVHYNVSFTRYLEPPPGEASEKVGWRAEVTPPGHTVSSYDFDVLIGADGRRNTLEGFQRKAFRAKLAIAITANFINRNTPEEQDVPELSGMARIYNQQFFRGLHDATGIDLENIVYYKDATHYFVMTAKKASLLMKKVLIEDFSDADRLLDRANIDRDSLAQYALEAAQFSTNHQMPNLEFAINQHGDPDVHVFDFTNMYAAENASRIVERHGHRLLIALVGDSLIEPFWPLGTGCAHGFLGVFDAAWMLRQWGLGQRTPLQLIVERETIYRSLSSISPEQLSKQLSNYTIDPQTRYNHVDFSNAMIFRFRHLFDTDSKDIDKTELAMVKRTLSAGHAPKRMRRETVSEDVLLDWLREQLESYGVNLTGLIDFWKDFQPLSALIHRFRPELIDLEELSAESAEKNMLAALKIAEEQLGMVLTFTPGNFMRSRENIPFEDLVVMIGQLYDVFRRDKPGEFKLDLSMDSSSSPLDLLGRWKGGDSQRRVPLSPHSAKRTSTKETAKDGAQKRRRAFQCDPLAYKRRESLENAGAVINMGEKIKFLEAAFNPDRGRQEGPLPRAAVKKSYPLTEKLFGLEPSRLPVEVPESRQDARDGEKFDPDLVERLLEDYRAHGRNGLEAKYGPELIRQVLFEDKKRDMADKLNGQRDDDKYAEIDYKLKKCETQLREGSALQPGTSKVSSLTEDYTTVLQVEQRPHPPLTPKSSVDMPWTPELAAKVDQTCFFCQKRVYLAERKSLEGLFFHRVCFRCHYCEKLLQVNGDYAYDRYDPSGGKFYCKGHIQFRKHDLALLTSPQRETAPTLATKKSSVGVQEIFTFNRYPSRSDVTQSSGTALVSPRHVDDDEEDNSDDSVMDDEEVLRHNFGDSFNSFSGETEKNNDGDESSTSDDDLEDAQNVVGKDDWTAAELAVQNWGLARLLRTASSSESSSHSGKPVKNVCSESTESEVLHNAYEDTTSPSSLSDQECDQEVLSVTSPAQTPPKPLTTPLPTPPQPAPRKAPKIPHSPYPEAAPSSSDDSDNEDRQAREEIVSVNGKNVHVRQTAAGNCFLTVLPGENREKGVVGAQGGGARADTWLDPGNVVPALDFASSRKLQPLGVSASLRESSSGSEAYYTPLSALSEGRRKSTSSELKWNTDILDTARRLRAMRMSDDSTGTDGPATGTPPVVDDVFFTPQTSFPIARPRKLIIPLENDPEIARKLDFDQSSDDLTSSTPSSRDEVKLHWSSVAQTARAAARARAMLKSDEELGIRSPRRTRKNSSSSGSDQPGSEGVQRAKSPGSQNGGWLSPGAIEQNVDDGQAVVTIGELFTGIKRHSIAEASPRLDSPETYFSRKAAQNEEKYQKQESTKLFHKAQEIQRLLDETEAHLEDLTTQVVSVENALRRPSREFDTPEEEEQIRDEWLKTSQERHKVRLQLEELKLMAENVQLEERYRVAQEQMRRLLAVEDDRKTGKEKKDEADLLDEILSVRRQKEEISVKIARCQSQRLDKS